MTEESKATLIGERDKWYNAFEEDIAVANFFFTKPTAIGEKTNVRLDDDFYVFIISFRIQKDGEHEIH